MKTLLIGLLALSSISAAFADCKYKVLSGDHNSRILTSIKASLANENCLETKKLAEANFIVTSTEKTYGNILLPDGGLSNNGCMISVYGKIDANVGHDQLGALVRPEEELGEKCLSNESLKLLNERFIQNLRDSRLIPAVGYAGCADGSCK